jgi:hypothetical protein
VLSINDDGHVTVAYSTGDQQATAAPASTLNRVISLTEAIDDNNEYVARLNWYHDLTGAKRVTGPMVLFNRGLFYAASRPPDTTASACDRGAGDIYGAHFEDDAETANGGTPSPASGPAKAPQVPDLLVDSQASGLIFGVSVEGEPTCFSEEETFSGDDSFGYGAVTMSRTVKPGRFFLAYEVSGGDTSAATPEPPENRIELTSRHEPVSVESWAPIYE